MNEILELQRNVQALEVIRLILLGSTQKDACQKVGVDPRTWQRWVSEGLVAEAAQAISVDLLNQTQAAVASNLAFIVATEEDRVRQMVDMALNKMTEDRDRIAANTWLEKYKEIKSMAKPAVSFAPWKREVDLRTRILSRLSRLLLQPLMKVVWLGR